MNTNIKQLKGVFCQMTRCCLLLAGVSLAALASAQGAEISSAKMADPALAVPRNGLVLWLDASDSRSLMLAGGDVREWRDRSGKGHHLSQKDKEACPRIFKLRRQGPSALSFDGATQYLSGPAVLPEGQNTYTIIALWRSQKMPDSPSASQSIFEQAAPGASSARGALALMTHGDTYGFAGENNDWRTTIHYTPGIWRLTSLSVDNGRKKNIRICDSGMVYEGACPHPETLKLGAAGITVGRKLAEATDFFDGELAEILVYDRVLSPEEETALRSEIDRKWGVDCPSDFHSPDGRVLTFDFEGNDWGEWQQEGTAFGSKPSIGPACIGGYLGQCDASSASGGNGPGKLTSPHFVIERPFINFVISGAKNPGKAGIQLIIDGKAVRTTTGPNTKSPAWERLEWASWDVAEFIGKTATIQIIGSKLGMEHINVDAIMQSHQQYEETPAQREITIVHPYLHLPVKNGARERRMRFVVDGKTVREFTIELADGNADFWACSEVGDFKGKKLRIEVDQLSDAAVLNDIVQADAFPGAKNLYREKYRLQFHFSTRSGTTYEPDGLVYYKGEYHLFFQIQPYMLKRDYYVDWGHAVSKDLVHWEELPIAIYPYKFGGHCWTGSAMVDKANTAGFKNGSEDPMVIIYTSVWRGPCMIYSTDRGRTFTEYSGNPVAAAGDGRIIWHEASQKWVMIATTELSKGRGMAFFSSPDLKKWERHGVVEDGNETPSFFELPVDGDKAHSKWVLFTNSIPSMRFAEGHGRYAIGTFDGKVFTPDETKIKYNFGNAYGVAVTYNDIPAADGRRINISWAEDHRMMNGIPGMPFNQWMNFPTEFTLRTTEEGPRLFTRPIKEIESLYTKTREFSGIALSPEGTVLPGVEGDLFDISAEFATGAETEEVGFKIRGVPVTFNVKSGQLACLDCKAPLKPVEGKVKLRLLVDRTSIEIFANDGRIYMPMAVIPKNEERSITVFAKGADAKVTALSVNFLKSAWLK